MNARRSSGFTIIESILFLAIASLLMLITMTAFSGRTSEVRATDSMRSLTAMMNEKYNQVLAGVNITDSTGGGVTEGQVMLGRVFYFQPGSSDVQIVTIIGQRLFGDDLNLASGEDEWDLIQRATPEAFIGSEEAHRISWGTTFVEARNRTGDPTPTYTMVGFIRSPGSNNIYPFAVRSPHTPAGLNDPRMFNSALTPGPGPAQRPTLLGQEVNLELCFLPATNRLSAIRYGSGRSTAIDLVGETNTC